MGTVLYYIGLGLNIVGAVAALGAVMIEVRAKGLQVSLVRVGRQIVSVVRVRSKSDAASVHLSSGDASAISGAEASAQVIRKTGNPTEDRLSELEAAQHALEERLEAQQRKTAEQIANTQADFDQYVEDFNRTITEEERREVAVDTWTKDVEMWGLFLVGLGTVLQGIFGR